MSFVEWWQTLPSRIDPNIFTIGDFGIRWYSLGYLVAFAVTYILVRYRLKTEDRFKFNKALIDDLFLWLIIGLIVGARLGYAVFYNFGYYAAHPLEIFIPFSGGEFTGLFGMSFHGGLIGTVLAAFIFCKVKKVSFWEIGDLFVPAIPLGFTFGRLGNFMNGELWGRMTDAAWGMYFPNDSSGLLRHPSQLYEAFFEGILLFIILWALRKKHIFDGFQLALYLILYALARIFVELFREPDAHLGFIFGPLTMGQLLSIVMVLFGVGIIFWKTKKRPN